jgi:coproporphyrinogen III oxidase-like Fe-S oxidoreductase
MLQLRLAVGVRFVPFANQTGFDPRVLWPELLDRLRMIGLLDIDDDGFRLTEKGVNVADAVAAEFLDPSA